MSTTTKRMQPTTTFSQGESRNGTPDKLVAEIELATPASVRGPRNLELAQKPALLDRIETTHS